MRPNLILASSSPHRRRLLARLGLAFTVRAPQVDESAAAGEAAEPLARRLARAKAEAIAAGEPEAVVIGSDQVAALDGHILGKPGSVERAVAQLRACAGRRVTFHTAVHVAAPGGGAEHLDHTYVQFRALSEGRLRDYVHREQPLDCAGAFRCEGLGIALFERIDNEDPTALEGLPLIWLSAALARAGLPAL